MKITGYNCEGSLEREWDAREVRVENFILDAKAQELLGLMSIIPDIFKDILIFESDEIEDFDIGFCSFYLISRKDIIVNGHEFFEDPYMCAERLREKYSISFEGPNVGIQENLYDVTFFERHIISKPKNLLGDVEEELAIRPKIEKGLQADVAEDSGAGTAAVKSLRGTGHFGHVWQFVDGVNIDNSEEENMFCECRYWTRRRITLLTEHHPGCKYYNPEREAWTIINGLLNGITAWASDEDGVHPECWEAFEQAAYFIGRPELIKEESKS